tara:strand:- start:1049 stop:3451 length:2403 start_codon:yes stop_codon:yes gene_type:complete
MSIRSSLASYEQQILINNTFLPGVSSFDGSYQTSESPILAVGKGYCKSLIDSAPQGVFSMTRNMLYIDPLINFTGEDPMKIRVVYPSAHNVGDASLDIKDAYMGEYSVSCQVGELPQINNTFDVYGDMGSTIFFDDNHVETNFINDSVWERQSVTINPRTNGFPEESPRGLSEAHAIRFGDDSTGKGRIRVPVKDILVQDSFMISCQAKLINKPTGSSSLSFYFTGSEEDSPSTGRKDIDTADFTSGEWTKINIKLTRDIPLPDTSILYFNIEADNEVEVAFFNFNFIKTKEIKFNQEDSIPNMGSIHVSCDGSETNTITNFNYSISIERKPFYVVGDLEPKVIETIYPIKIAADFTMELDDYEVNNMKDVFTGLKERDIDITIKNRYNTVNGEMEFGHVLDTMSRDDRKPVNSLQSSLKIKDSTGLMDEMNHVGTRPIPIAPLSPVEGFNIWRVYKRASRSAQEHFALGITGRSIEEYFGYGRDYTFSTYVWIPGFMKATQTSEIRAFQYNKNTLNDTDQIIAAWGSGNVIDISDTSTQRPVDAKTIESWQRASVSFRPDEANSATHPDFGIVLLINLPAGLDAYTYLSCSQIENMDKPTPFKQKSFFTLPLKNAQLIGESFGGDSSDGSVVNLQYRGYINQPHTECERVTSEPYKEIDWPAPPAPIVDFSYYVIATIARPGGEKYCLSGFGSYDGTYVESNGMRYGRSVFMKEDGSLVMYYGRTTDGSPEDLAGGYLSDAYGSYPATFEHKWFLTLATAGSSAYDSFVDQQINVDNSGVLDPESSAWTTSTVTLGACP